MALRKLVDSDCGGTNSLVNLTSHFVQDRALKDEGFHGFSHSDHIASSNSEQLVQEFLEETMGHSTQPFRMDSLLAEMRDLECKLGPVRSPPVSQLTREEDVQSWAQQYLDAGKHFDESTGPGIWTMENAGSASNPSEDYLDLGIGSKWASEYLLRSQDNKAIEEPSTLADLSNSEEYIDTKGDIAEVAGEILHNAGDDPTFANSKFMKFMKQINEGDMMLDPLTTDKPEDSLTKTITAKHWSVDYPQSSWETEYLKDNLLQEKANDSAKNFNDEFNDFMWKKLSDQWDKLSSNKHEELWSPDFEDFSGNFREYKFANENPMRELTNPLDEGKAKLAMGDLPSAVLCFEAAVQNEPENAYAWQLLGTTQAENEQDPQAIIALKKCLLLEPTNLTALMAISVCYTNENFQRQACRALKEWLRASPHYSDLVSLDKSEMTTSMTSIMTKELYEEVKNMLLAAARRNPVDNIDPDIQCALGVLFNLSGEADMAVDCFKAALQVRPNDAAVWNRLGATLANGARSEEAVDAYRSALQLKPGFIRARYNLGITCVHLGAHKEAAEHLLTCLNQQAAGRGPQGSSSVQMSDSIWNTLRLVVASLLDRPDLIESLNTRNLDKLNKEFGID